MRWLASILRKLGLHSPTATADAPEFRVGDLSLQTSSATHERAELAMPGTSKLRPILRLTPPEIDPDLLPGMDDNGTRDIAPDPIAEFSQKFTAKVMFRRKDIAEAIPREWRKTVLDPMIYIVTPEGRTTFLNASDAPAECTALVFAWRLCGEPDITSKAILEASACVSERLLARKEGFVADPIDPKKIEAQLEAAQRIIAIRPHDVIIIAYNDETNTIMDGKDVWNTLHAMGFKWGDMDCFQWNDPAHQTDYLIWVEVDDRKYGYALPEEIAAGRQNFFAVRFILNPARTPSPEHVLEEMIRAADCFRQHMGCRLAAVIDQEPVEGPNELRSAVSSLGANLQRLNVKPGSSSVCRLR